MYLQFRVLTRAVAKTSLVFFSTNSRPDKSSIPCFWDILSLEKERLPRRLSCPDMNILPRLIWKILNKIFVVILLEPKTLFWGEKKHILTKFSAGYLRCHSFGNLQNRPMDAFHHFLMEFPSLPCCALPFFTFFIPPLSSLTALYLYSLSDRHFRIWTYIQFTPTTHP